MKPTASMKETHFPAVWKNIRQLMRKREFDVAFGLMNQLRSLDSALASAEYWWLDGELKFRRNELESSLAAFDRALRLGHPPQPLAYVKYGDVLLKAGRHQEAGKQFVRAHKAGQELRTLARLIAAEAATKGDEPEIADHMRFEIMTRSALLNPITKILYLPIPKNACSVLKVAFALNSDRSEEYQASGKYVHEYLNQSMFRFPPSEAWTDPEVVRFLVLRNPYDRILSAYLDKIVRTSANGIYANFESDVIERIQNFHGLPFNLKRSVSFHEFVDYLSATEDAELNVHWLPQSTLSGYDLAVFTHVGLFEQLEATFEFLQTRLGWCVLRNIEGHIARSTAHIARYADIGKGDWCDRLPGELYPLQAIPNPRQFYSDHAKEMVARRYAADIALYSSISQKWNRLPS